jgi:hypothetical protein
MPPEGREVMSRRITAAVTAGALTLILATGGASGGASSPGQQPPKNVTPPSVSGTARVPYALTASTGTWQGKRLKYAYQWLRCDSTGAGCNAISGSTSTTKALSASDVGYTLRVIVTATNRNGSAAATSAQSPVVASGANPPPPPPPPPVPPSNDTLPATSGTAQEGQTLTASAGTWSGTTPMTYIYQWQRCDSAGAACAAIAGATGTTYVLTAGDVGHTARVSVTASNSAGSATAASAATVPVTSGSRLAALATYNGFDGYIATVTNTVPYETIHYDSNGNYVRGWDAQHFPAVSGSAGQGLRQTVYTTDGGPNASSALDGISMNSYKSYVHSAKGESTWYRVKMKFPSGKFWPSPGEWNWIFEWHNDTHTSSFGTCKSMAFGVTAFSTTDRRLHFRPAGGNCASPVYEHFYTSSLQLDHWYDILIRIVWDTKASNNGGQGLIELYIDGQPPLNFTNPHPFPTLLSNPDGTYDHPGHALYNYRRNDWTTAQGNTSSSIDFDEWYVGPSRESVGG